MKERLQKIIANAGLASRRNAELLIQEGRVRVNGQIVQTLGSKADTSQDKIEVDGLFLDYAQDKVYVLLNKPPGYISTLNDPEGRPTVTALLSNIPERIVPVGRLDYDTEGLLVLTNDGDFSQILQHPRNKVARTYLVKVSGVPAERDLNTIRKKIHIEGIKTSKAELKIATKTRKNSWLEVVLYEGKNRQIKKMFESIGCRTMRIIRTDFGPLSLKDLPTGAYRFLMKKEINDIKKLEFKNLETEKLNKKPIANRKKGKTIGDK